MVTTMTLIFHKLTKWTTIILILFYATSLWGSIGNVDKLEGKGVIDRDKTDITLEEELPIEQYDTVKTGNVKVGKELAINPGHANSQLEGTPTKEPAFGLDAMWIEPAQKDYARTLGYTVVDAATAIATHLNTILRNNSSELLSHDETQQLLSLIHI